jgi:hypothetical protein
MGFLLNTLWPTKRVLLSDDGCLYESDIINLRDNTSISEVTDLLRKLTTEKWLAPTPADAGQLTLGPRSYLELISFLRDLEIIKCTICNYEMLQGVACQGKASCSTVLHHSCLDRYEAKGLTYKCAGCKLAVRR